MLHSTQGTDVRFRMRSISIFAVNIHAEHPHTRNDLMKCDDWRWWSATAFQSKINLAFELKWIATLMNREVIHALCDSSQTKYGQSLSHNWVTFDLIFIIFCSVIRRDDYFRWTFGQWAVTAIKWSPLVRVVLIKQILWVNHYLLARKKYVNVMAFEWKIAFFLCEKKSWRHSTDWILNMKLAGSRALTQSLWWLDSVLLINFPFPKSFYLSRLFHSSTRSEMILLFQYPQQLWGRGRGTFYFSNCFQLHETMERNNTEF